MTRMLTDEYGTASNIKSRVNRLSVLSAITSTQQRLKLYNRGMDKSEQPAKAILTYLCKHSSQQWLGVILWYHCHR